MLHFSWPYLIDNTHYRPCAWSWAPSNIMPHSPSTGRGGANRGFEKWTPTTGAIFSSQNTRSKLFSFSAPPPLPKGTYTYDGLPPHCWVRNLVDLLWSWPDYSHKHRLRERVTITHLALNPPHRTPRHVQSACANIGAYRMRMRAPLMRVLRLFFDTCTATW